MFCKIKIINLNKLLFVYALSLFTYPLAEAQYIPFGFWKANSGGIVECTGSTWTFKHYFKAPNNNANDEFGESTSVYGKRLAIGAIREDSNQTTITSGASSNNSSADSGAVYVFRKSGVTWLLEAYIKAGNNGANDQFGKRIDLYKDTLVVGAYFEDSNQTTITNGTGSSADNSAGSSGAVYVYKRSGTTWAQEAYIKAANAGAGDIFGAKVSIEGNTLAVSAFQERSNQTTITNGTTASSNNSLANSGAVYVYKRTGTTWAQEAYIKSGNNDSGDTFGESIWISGNTIAVGAEYEDSNQTTITNGTTSSADDSLLSAGAVYIYKRTGVTWAQEAYIKASNAGADDAYGTLVTIYKDTLAVGAYTEDSNQSTITNGTTASSNNSNGNSGAVYVYKRTGSIWAQEAYIKADNSNAGDQFGLRMAVWNDRIAVSSQTEDSNQTTITVGGSANNSSSNSGAVYIFKRTGVIWAQEAYIKAPNNRSGDFFGISFLSMRGNQLLVGHRYEKSSQTTVTTTAASDTGSIDSGAAYLFQCN